MKYREVIETIGQLFAAALGIGGFILAILTVSLLIVLGLQSLSE